MFFFLANTSISVFDENGELSSTEAPAAALDTLTQIPPGDYGLAFVKMFVTLIVFVVLLFGTFWFLRKLIQQRLNRGVGDAAIQILEKRMISPKTMLYLIEIENKKVLIAESHLEVRRIESFTESRPLEESDPQP